MGSVVFTGGCLGFMMGDLNEEHLTGLMKPPAAFMWAHFLLVVPRHAKTFDSFKKKKKAAV